MANQNTMSNAAGMQAPDTHMKASKFMFKLDDTLSSSISGLEEYTEVFSHSLGAMCVSAPGTGGSMKSNVPPTGTPLVVELDLGLAFPVLYEATLKNQKFQAGSLVMLSSANTPNQKIMEINFTGLSIEQIEINSNFSESYKIWIRYNTIEINFNNFGHEDATNKGSVVGKFNFLKGAVE